MSAPRLSVRHLYASCNAFLPSSTRLAWGSVAGAADASRRSLPTASRSQNAVLHRRALHVVPTPTMAGEAKREAGPGPKRGELPAVPATPVPPLFRRFPPWTHPYLYLVRLDKPAGTLLLYLPCTWSIAMATYSDPAVGLPYMVYMLGLFGAGSLIMRGAGCIVNDLWDIEFDRKVERTRTRPLASGTVKVPQALAFLGLNLAAGLAVLTQLNTFSIALGASSLLLVASYPLMKRVTYWPQLFLGLTFNWGALLGWSAVLGGLNPFVCLPLYAAGILWTLHYDTIYALQDKADDIHAGVKSTALLFGDSVTQWLSTFAAGSVGLLALSGLANGQGWPFFAGVAGAAGHMAWQIATLNIRDPKAAWAKFVSNRQVGYILLAGIVVDILRDRFFS
ncbi:4-hydroxybenzoate polyprenyltransferase, mitochondrial-like protein [Hyaloraphidium curvatum]|nr:4-hydroxybenzoate polyprenyltransferase, mitochondrial-like protein [Hyaloraphidium curvatum]